MGVKHVWILDPATTKSRVYTDDGFLEPRVLDPECGDLIAPGTPIRIVQAEIFAELEEGL